MDEWGADSTSNPLEQGKRTALEIAGRDVRWRRAKQKHCTPCTGIKRKGSPPALSGILHSRGVESASCVWATEYFVEERYLHFPVAGRPPAFRISSSLDRHCLLPILGVGAHSGPGRPGPQRNGVLQRRRHRNLCRHDSVGDHVSGGGLPCRPV